MNHDPDDWPAAAWRSIDAAPPALPTLQATLGAARAVCDAAGLDAPRSPDFDPATGWAYLDGILAGLELATGLTPRRSDAWPLFADREDARSLLDRLLRHAADICLSLAEPLRAEGVTADLLAVAGVARQLPDAYQVTLGQPW
jgi:hypothetical protein